MRRFRPVAACLGIIIVGFLAWLHWSTPPKELSRTLPSSTFSNPDGKIAPDPRLPSSIEVVSPAPGETLTAGRSYVIKWRTVNVGPQLIFINLLSQNGTLVDLHLSREFNEATGDWEGGDNTGFYSWSIPTSTPTGEYRLEFETAANAPTGENTAQASSGIFTIQSEVPPPNPPVILKVTHAPFFLSYGGSYHWNLLLVEGSGLSHASKAELVDDAGTRTHLEFDSSNIDRVLDDRVLIQVPYTVTPGYYRLLVYGEYGTRSKPFSVNILPGIEFPR